VGGPSKVILGRPRQAVILAITPVIWLPGSISQAHSQAVVGQWRRRIKMRTWRLSGMNVEWRARARARGGAPPVTQDNGSNRPAPGEPVVADQPTDAHQPVDPDQPTDADQPAGQGPDGSPTRHWSVTALDPRASSVARVRHQARAVLAAWGAEDYEWVVIQLLSEVATNAVLHAGSPFDVSLTFANGLVRCEVRDGDARPPRTRHYSAQSTTGRGIRMVEQLSRSWGVIRGGTGKTVWFEVTDSMDGLDPLAQFEDADATEPGRVSPADTSVGSPTAADLLASCLRPAGRCDVRLAAVA